MRRINLIKTISTISVLGISSIAFVTSLTSCNKSKVVDISELKIGDKLKDATIKFNHNFDYDRMFLYVSNNLGGWLIFSSDSNLYGEICIDSNDKTISFDGTTGIFKEYYSDNQIKLSSYTFDGHYRDYGIGNEELLDILNKYHEDVSDLSFLKGMATITFPK
ncbi:MAG: hypothetical protein LBJ97_03910 [Mycoplasmataceae bacterium]|jgi:hypothetical protein|nr:hypothetical protein [Mycoplasmataceae bacterium]